MSIKSRLWTIKLSNWRNNTFKIWKTCEKNYSRSNKCYNCARVQRNIYYNNWNIYRKKTASCYLKTTTWRLNTEKISLSLTILLLETNIYKLRTKKLPSKIKIFWKHLHFKKTVSRKPNFLTKFKPFNLITPLWNNNFYDPEMQKHTKKIAGMSLKRNIKF